MLEILAESEGFSGRALRKLPFQVGGSGRGVRKGVFAVAVRPNRGTGRVFRSAEERGDGKDWEGLGW